jgi:hypothetical protein
MKKLFIFMMMARKRRIDINANGWVQKIKKPHRGCEKTPYNRI